MGVKEFFLYLSHLTFSRVLNLLLCGVGYLFSQILRYPVVLGKPWSVSIEPTTRCNFQCPECPTGIGELGRRAGDMALDRFIDIINEIEHTTSTVLLHFQGEPLMNPDIYKMVEYASSKRIITEMATNATLLDKEASEKLVKSGLKKIVISIDSPSEKEFGMYRKGGQLTGVLLGIENIQQAKLKYKTGYPLLCLELLAFKNNVSRIEDFVTLGKSLRADVIRVKTVQLLNLEDAADKIPIGTKYCRYEKRVDGSIALKGKANSPCSVPWYKCSLTHDGWIVPCCFDKSATYLLGSINTHSLNEVWYSKHYNNFRKRLIRHRRLMPVCSTCPQGRVKIDFNVG